MAIIAFFSSIDGSESLQSSFPHFFYFHLIYFMIPLVIGPFKIKTGTIPSNLVDESGFIMLDRVPCPALKKATRLIEFIWFLSPILI